MFTDKKVTKIIFTLYLCYIQYFNFHFVSSYFGERGLYGKILPMSYWGRDILSRLGYNPKME